MIPIKVNNDSLSFMIMIIKNILLAHIIIKVPQQCYIKGALILKNWVEVLATSVNPLEAQASYLAKIKGC